MDFDAAIKAHKDWRYRLLTFVAGTSKEKLDPDVIACDDKCALGKWIHGSCRPAMGHDKRCQSLVTSHANFHRSAGEVVRQKLGGDQKSAMKSLKSNFTKYSEETIHNIEIMRKAWPMRGAAAAPAAARKPAQIPPGLAQGEDEWEEF
jgi:hypothetical protein